MKINKEKTFLLTLSLLIAFFAVVFALLVVYSFTTNGSLVNNTFRAPIIVPVNIVNNPAQPLAYDLNGQRKLLKYLSSPEPLSQKDLIVKKHLASLLPMGSNIVYTSKNIEIDYIRNAGLFQGKIISKNFGPAEQEAVNWLKQQGLSQTGICNLPLMFYVAPNIADESRGVYFNPLPPGC